MNRTPDPRYAKFCSYCTDFHDPETCKRVKAAIMSCGHRVESEADVVLHRKKGVTDA